MTDLWLKRIGGALEKCSENHACGTCGHKGKIKVLGLENPTIETSMFFERISDVNITICG